MKRIILLSVAFITICSNASAMLFHYQATGNMNYVNGEEIQEVSISGDLYIDDTQHFINGDPYETYYDLIDFSISIGNFLLEGSGSFLVYPLDTYLFLNPSNTVSNNLNFGFEKWAVWSDFSLFDSYNLLGFNEYEDRFYINEDVSVYAGSIHLEKVNPVPEPATIVMLGLGITGLLLKTHNSSSSSRKVSLLSHIGRPQETSPRGAFM